MNPIIVWLLFGLAAAITNVVATRAMDADTYARRSKKLDPEVVWLSGLLFASGVIGAVTVVVLFFWDKKD